MQEYLVTLEAMLPMLADVAGNILMALLTLGIGWWISSLLGRWVRRVATRSPRIDATIVPMFATVVVWAVRVFTIIAVLARFGVQTASLIAVLGAAGLAVGLALQNTLQNIAAGIMLLILRPLRVGEYVALSNGTDGTVAEVGLFLCRLVKVDGIHITLPNSVVWNATITNFSRNETRRLDLPVIIRYSDDLDAAIKSLSEIVANHPSVLQSPAPLVKVEAYQDNGVVVNVRVWSPSGKYLDLRWDLFHQIRLTLAASGFKPPIPVREIQAPGKADSAE